MTFGTHRWCSAPPTAGQVDGAKPSASMQMPDEYFASSGHRPVAARLFELAGLGPQDVDVAEIYDHFSPMVIMQLEDYGFCRSARAALSLPTATSAGRRSAAGEHPRWQSLRGLHHRHDPRDGSRGTAPGTAVNQVAGAEVALVTGGPAGLPVSSLLLRRDGEPAAGDLAQHARDLSTSIPTAR